MYHRSLFVRQHPFHPRCVFQVNYPSSTSETEREKTKSFVDGFGGKRKHEENIRNMKLLSFMELAEYR